MTNLKTRLEQRIAKARQKLAEMEARLLVVEEELKKDSARQAASMEWHRARMTEKRP